MLKLFTEFPMLKELRPLGPGEIPFEQYDFVNCYTVKHPEGSIERGDLAAALILSSGVLNEAAKMLLRTRSEVETAIKNDRELVSLRDDAVESFLDEMQHLQSMAARGGDVGAQRFFLTTLGSHRGFSNLQRLAGPSGGPLETVSEINLIAQPIPKRDEDSENDSLEHSPATEDGGKLPAGSTHEGIQGGSGQREDPGASGDGPSEGDPALA